MTMIMMIILLIILGSPGDKALGLRALQTHQRRPQHDIHVCVSIYLSLSIYIYIYVGIYIYIYI